MLFVFPSSVYPRRTEERLFKGLYQFGNILYVISFVVLATQFYMSMQSTFPDYFFTSKLSMYSGLKIATQDCDYEATVFLGSVHISVDVKSSSLSLPLLLFAQYVFVILVVQFIAIVHGAFSMLNYSSLTRHLRLCGVHIPIYHILVVFSFLYCILLTFLVALIYPTRNFYANGIQACAAQKMVTNRTQLLRAEYNDSNIFSISIELVLIAAAANMLINLAGVCVLVWKSRDPATVLFSEAAVPWESRGVMCKTNKMALRIHTAARDVILKEARDAIASGERVRIACSYALMTEADYEAQLEEMRQEFDAQVKEQQFEHMRTHFERESDLEEDGLLWRRQAPLSPPPPNDLGYIERGSGVDKFNADETFADIFDENTHKDLLWGNSGDENYELVTYPDEGGDFSGVALKDTALQRRHHKRRYRHRRHQQTVENEVALQDTNELSELSDGGVAVLGERDVEQQEGKKREEVDADRPLRRRHHHHHRQRGEAIEVADGDIHGRSSGVLSPLEDADEL